MTEDKATLTRQRLDLIASLNGPLPAEERVRVQGEISIINAKIKTLNTTEAVRQKVTADRRKISGSLVAGQSQFEANTARAQAKIASVLHQTKTIELAAQAQDEEDDPTAVIDGWIDAVLLRHDIVFTRARDGEITIHDGKGAAVLKVLIDGVYAAGRGQPLPDLPPAPPRAAPKPLPKAAKPKKR